MPKPDATQVQVQAMIIYLLMAAVKYVATQRIAKR